MSDAARDTVTLAQATRVWARIGLLGFGGPAGQVALMHRELVEERRWIDEERFLHALNYCMLLPGPEAQQLAIYIGWLLHRTVGGIIAGVLFVLPGFAVVLGLSVLYALYRELPAVAAALFGLKAAVLAIVVEAVLRIGRRALRGRAMVAVAALAFVALFAFAAPFPLVIALAGAIGVVLGRRAPDLFPLPADPANPGGDSTLIGRLHAAGALDHTRPSTARAIRVALVCVALWAAPIVGLALAFGGGSVFVTEGLFFSHAAVVTFGGAYAVLAYIAQRAVEAHGWLMPGEMLDGLGLAETTPGPLILVVEFVGFLGAYRQPGELAPLAAGVLGAVVTVWVTFVPCFLWIFLGAPYIERLRGNRALRAALSTITAAVVGVILDLSIWFGVHVLFGQTAGWRAGPLALTLPVLASVDLAALALATLATLAIVRFRLGVPLTLALCAGLGLGWKLLA